ncbi:MAG TPA: restriction endonuclease subunit S [Bacillales bacterium]|nr:restriction endonuclease subunit S [Bacillales bacterium]
MTGWKRGQLGESVEVQGGYAFKSRDFVDDGIPVVRMSNIKDGRLSFETAKYLPPHKIDSHRPFLLKEGDIILGMSGSIENFAVVKEQDLPAILNQRVGRFLVKDENKMDRNFLRYVITSHSFKNKVMESAAGAAQLNISPRQLQAIDISYPPLPEQRKIAAILSTVDGDIEQTEMIIDQAEKVKKGLLERLLMKGIGHGEYKKTEIGEIPAQWKVVALKDYVKEYRGGASITPKDFSEKGTKVLPKKGVSSRGIFDIPANEQSFVSVGFSRRNPRSSVDRSFLITVLRDLVPSGPNIGRIVQIDDDDCYMLAQGVYGFKLTEGLNETFLIYLSNASYFRKEMKRKLVGSTQVHMRTGDFFDTLIPLPDFREQRQIADILFHVDEKIRKEHRKLNELRKLKKGLMQVLLTGRVRVEATGKEAEAL